MHAQQQQAKNFPFPITTEFDDYTIIDIKRFEKWSEFNGYAYHFSRSKIKQALEILPKHRDMIYDEIHLDWWNAKKLSKSSICPTLKHYCRIAALIELIPTKGIEPITIDTFNYSAPSRITDGHHRMLALKFLKVRTFPVFFNGIVDHLDWLEQK